MINKLRPSVAKANLIILLKGRAEVFAAVDYIRASRIGIETKAAILSELSEELSNLNKLIDQLQTN